MFIWIIIIIIAFWLIIKHYSRKDDVSLLEQGNLKEDVFISEEKVFEIQNKFEESLQNTYLPDAITHKDLYIYKHIMCDWYDKISGKNRYDDKIIQKLRNDWIDYMEALEDRETYSFLSFEAEEDKKESYRNKHVLASRKVFAIEEAFASMIGGDAIKKLKEIRETNHFDFNREGEMAPKGYTFDIQGNVRKDKK